MHFELIDAVLCETVVTESVSTLIVDTGGVLDVHIVVAHLADEELHG